MNNTNNLWLIIVNTGEEGDLGTKRWQPVEQELQRQGISYTVKFTEHPGNAARLTDDAILNGYRKILGVGNDRTNHEICNGILSNQWVAPSEILYGMLPVGRGNAWAKQLKVSRSLRVRLENLKPERSVMQDAGQVFFQKNGRQESQFFVNTTGIAPDAFLARLEAEGKILGEPPYSVAVRENALKICL